jgi:putative acetyltransferase
VGEAGVSAPAAPRIEVIEAHTPDAIAAARALILEYQASLGLDLAFQHFDDEIAALATMYGPPEGALFLATLDGVPAGCVGVRRFAPEPRCCEMKRLYVVPTARGFGMGRRLALQSMAAGRALGYTRMRLDTLPTMRDAQALYDALGFCEIPAYRHSPVPGTRYLEAAL